MTELELYYSFRSPYSYLAIDPLIALCDDYGVAIDFRIVRPLALREPDFFKKGRRQFVPYLLKDVFREAARLGVEFRWPNPDPIDMDLVKGEIAKEQPVFDHVLKFGGAAALSDQGAAFASVIGRAIWGGVENWHSPEMTREILTAGGLDFDVLERVGSERAGEIAEMIERNEAQQIIHHWGVPLMVYDGEPFFGQDRIDALAWRFDQLGLKSKR